MSSWRLSNVDEMARFTCAEEGSPLLKEKMHRRAMSVVDFTAVGCGLPSAGGAFCPDVVVRVAADDDGVVPGRPGGGTIVRVAGDDDGVVLGRPGGGTPQSPAWCSLLQMTALLKIRRSGGTSPMEGMARWPQ